MANKDPVLSFKEFCGKPGSLGGRNNFHMRFANNILGDFEREGSVAYKRCMSAHPDEFGKLSTELRGRTDYYSFEYLKKLYEAYKLMRRYAETDLELFE